MPNSNTDDFYASEEISILDILLVITENLRLLVVGPVLVGVLALGGSFLWPRTYESVAIIKPTATTVMSGQQISASMLMPSVLDAVIANLHLQQSGQSMDEARLALKKNIKSSFNAKDNLVTVSGLAHTPEQAQALLNDLLNTFFAQSKPKAEEQARLNQMLQSTQARIQEANIAAKQMQQRIAREDSKSSADTAQGYATLVNTVDGLEKRAFDMSKELAGVDASALVQEPSLDRLKTSPKRSLVALVATLGALFVLLLWVFARAAWVKASASPETDQKLSSLKQAWRKALGRV
jgi:capsular polysaccharide biosynthesis protein